MQGYHSTLPASHRRVRALSRGRLDALSYCHVCTLHYGCSQQAVRNCTHVRMHAPVRTEQAKCSVADVRNAARSYHAAPAISSMPATAGRSQQVA